MTVDWEFTRRAAMLGASGLALACAPASRDGLEALFAQSFQAQLRRDPTWAAMIGRGGPHDRWTLRTEAWFEQTARAADAALNRAAAFRAAQPVREPGDDLDVFVFDQTAARELARWRDHDYAFYNWTAPHLAGPGHLRSYQTISNAGDADAYLSKLVGLSELIAVELDYLERQDAAGVRPPAFNFPAMTDTARQFAQQSRDPDAHGHVAVRTDLAGKLEGVFSEHESRAYLQAADAVLREKLAPALDAAASRLLAVQSRALTDHGVWALPDGDEFYRALIRRHTTLDLDPEALHVQGEAEIARLRGELGAVVDELGWRGGVSEFLRFLRSDAQFFLPDTEAGRVQYLASAQGYVDAIMRDWPRIISIAPPQPMDIRTPDPAIGALGGRASYSDPAADGSRPGFVLLNPYLMRANPTYQLAAVMFHEGVPGHHIQACAAMAAAAAPDFRKHLYINGFVEGWALYAERLAGELGHYRTPFERAGRIALELFRAVRIVVDTGIHHKRWSFSQALAYMNVNTANPEADNEPEVRRYFNWPGQALGYKVGMDHILGLRARAQAALGVRFNLVAFHDAVLGAGALPLEILSRRVAALLMEPA